MFNAIIITCVNFKGDTDSEGAVYPQANFLGIRV
jgi:hypothetical protein